jgi:hypothetical protein
MDAVNLKYVAEDEKMRGWINSACSEAKRRSKE